MAKPEKTMERVIHAGIGYLDQDILQEAAPAELRWHRRRGSGGGSTRTSTSTGVGTSTTTGGDGELEVAATGDWVMLRDTASQNPDKGPVLVFRRQVWDEHVNAAKNGEYDNIFP